MRKILINLLRFAAFLTIGLIILYLVYNNLEGAYAEECAKKGIPEGECSYLNKVYEDFRSVNPLWIGLTFVAFTLSNLSRAIRWNMLLKPLGYQPRLINTFLSIIIMYCSNLFLPRVGEVIRAGTLSKIEHMPMDKVMGTVVVERLIDFVSLIIIIGFAFIWEYDTIWSAIDQASAEASGKEGRGNLWLILLGGLMVLGVVGIFLKNRLKNTMIYKRGIKFINGVVEGLRSIRGIDKPGWFILNCFNIFFMYFLMTYLCFFSFEPTSHLTVGAGLMVFIFGALGIVVPSPGGLGSYHILVILALSMFAIPKTEAGSFANIIFFSVQIGYNVVFGLLAFAVIALINKNYVPSHVVQEVGSDPESERE